MKTFFLHIGYIGKMKKNFHISRFQYPTLTSRNKMKFNEIDAKRGVVSGLRTNFLIAKKWF